MSGRSVFIPEDYGNTRVLVRGGRRGPTRSSSGIDLTAFAPFLPMAVPALEAFVKWVTTPDTLDRRPSPYVSELEEKGRLVSLGERAENLERQIAEFTEAEELDASQRVANLEKRLEGLIDEQ